SRIGSSTQGEIFLHEALTVCRVRPTSISRETHGWSPRRRVPRRDAPPQYVDLPAEFREARDLEQHLARDLRPRPLVTLAHAATYLCRDEAGELGEVGGGVDRASHGRPPRS